MFSFTKGFSKSVQINKINKKKELIVAVVPLFKFNQKILKLITGAIEKFYGLKTVVLKTARIPKKFYYKKLSRYNASKILDWFDETVGLLSEYFKVIGVTHKDIYTKKGKYKYWGILGLGSVLGKSCVISTKRCKRALKTQKQFYDRVVKLTLHELGHTFGLMHCNYSKTCFMQDAKGTVLTLDKEKIKLCEKCKKLVVGYLKRFLKNK